MVSLLNLTPQAKKRAIFIALWLTLALLLIVVRSVILPVLLASLLAYVFHPIVGEIGRLHIRGRAIPRWISVITIYLIFAGIVLLFGIFFIPQFYSEMVRLAKDLTIFINSIDDNTINRMGAAIEEFFRTYQLPVEIVAPVLEGEKHPMPTARPNWISIDLIKMSHDLLNDTLIYLKSEAKNIINSARHIFSEIIESLFMILLILMITGFLLVDVDLIKNFAFSLVPTADRPRFALFLQRLDQRLSGVVRGQLTICLVNAILTLIGLILFNVKFAFILATMAGIFSLVPIFGSIVSTIPIVLVALTSSPFTGLCALIWIIGIHILEANFLNPKIMGNSAKIHPVLIILSLLIGEHYYGIIGALLAVPITSIIVTIFLSVLGIARSMDEGVFKPNQK